MKVFMVWYRDYDYCDDRNYNVETIQRKVVFSIEEGLEAIPDLIEERCKHIRDKKSSSYLLTKENKIKVYENFDWVLKDMFFVEEIDPFYIEPYLFPVKIREKMMLYGLNLMKQSSYQKI